MLYEVITASMKKISSRKTTLISGTTFSPRRRSLLRAKQALSHLSYTPD